MSGDDLLAGDVTPTRPPRVHCRCGRQLTATTVEPYWTVPAERGERRRAYYYVRAHRRPDGGPCPDDTAPAVGVVR